MSHFWHVRDHWVSNKQLVINNSASETRRTRRMCSQNSLEIGPDSRYYRCECEIFLPEIINMFPRWIIFSKIIWISSKTFSIFFWHDSDVDYQSKTLKLVKLGLVCSNVWWRKIDWQILFCKYRTRQLLRSDNLFFLLKVWR